MSEFFLDLYSQFQRAFIVDSRWRYYVTGLKNTLILTFFALIIGVALGSIVALIRSSWDMSVSEKERSAGKFAHSVLNWICKVYLTVIRGTPAAVQLSIIFFIIMADSNNKILCGVVAFGINSGAYVAEIIRAGIMSIDKGQMEAGRSLGFSYIPAMWYIIMPQAFKNILPALGNEFIVLLKETAIVGLVALTDLTRAASIVRSVTYQPFFPLIAVALIYLVMVMFLTWLLEMLERRLRNSDH